MRYHVTKQIDGGEVEDLGVTEATNAAHAIRLLYAPWACSVLEVHRDEAVVDSERGGRRLIVRAIRERA